MPWIEVWRWGLWTTSACGAIIYLSLGMPTLPWFWVICAGLCGALAHVAANKALSWGDASLLIPISGAKPLVLVGMLPLFMGEVLPPQLMYACLLATFGIVLTSIVPSRTHKDSPHPYWGFGVMWIGVVFMVCSDLGGANAIKQLGNDHRIEVIAGWCMCMGIAPTLSLVAHRHARPWPARFGAMGLGIVFAGFLACMTMAISLAPNPAIAVAEVNIVVAFRGLASVLIVLAIDRWLAMALEPLPRWVHALRLLGAGILGSAVALALT
jgi:drug/metabolite transporter (DMT)-like permease